MPYRYGLINRFRKMRIVLVNSSLASSLSSEISKFPSSRRAATQVKLCNRRIV